MLTPCNTRPKVEVAEDKKEHRGLAAKLADEVYKALFSFRLSHVLSETYMTEDVSESNELQRTSGGTLPLSTAASKP